MPDSDDQPNRRDPEDTRKTQATQPAKGKPIQIPVPKRDEVEDLIDRAANKRH